MSPEMLKSKSIDELDSLRKLISGEKRGLDKQGEKFKKLDRNHKLISAIVKSKKEQVRRTAKRNAKSSQSGGRRTRRRR